MSRSIVTALAGLVCFGSVPVMADSSCGSFRAAVPAPPLDLAPPAGFIEICGQDASLCAKFAAGYPPTSKMVGFFVTPGEWQRYREADLQGFTRYLIAQVAEGTPPSDFVNLRAFIRSRQGQIPDNTDLPPVFDLGGRSVIGVFEDSEDAMASGVIMRLNPTQQTDTSAMVLASANIAFLADDRVLSLYVFADVTARPSAEPVKQLTTEWLQCLRHAKRERGLTSR